MNRARWLGLFSFTCAAIGLLLIFKVIRPFRDMVKDGPLAMTCWGVGAIVSLSCFFGPQRSIALAIIGLLVNLVLIVVLAAVLLLLSHSNLAWH
jgi:hypothetical protein